MGLGGWVEKDKLWGKLKINICSGREGCLTNPEGLNRIESVQRYNSRQESVRNLPSSVPLGFCQSCRVDVAFVEDGFDAVRHLPGPCA